MIPDRVRRNSKIASDTIIDTIEEYFLAAAEKIKEVIKDSYIHIAGQTVVENSQSNLILYKNLFDTRVDNFKYVTRNGAENIKISVPDMDTFNFMDLEMVQSIFEGISGRYVEISESEYNIINRIDNKVSPKKKTYLIRETKEIVDIEDSIFKKKLTRFPFSNKPPLHREVFGKAEDFVDEHMSSWIEKAIEVGKARIKNTFEGVR